MCKRGRQGKFWTRQQTANTILQHCENEAAKAIVNDCLDCQRNLAAERKRRRQDDFA